MNARRRRRLARRGLVTWRYRRNLGDGRFYDYDIDLPVDRDTPVTVSAGELCDMLRMHGWKPDLEGQS